MSFGPVTPSGIGRLKFEFKKFDKQSLTASWEKMVRDGQKYKWWMKLSHQAEPIDLGDDSKDEKQDGSADVLLPQAQLPVLLDVRFENDCLLYGHRYFGIDGALFLQFF